MRLLFLSLVSALLLAAVAGGCGAAIAVSGAHRVTSLTIRTWPQGKGKPGLTVRSLTCRPSGGTLPRPVGACALLFSKAGQQALAPTPPGQACTMIYGGPQQAEITGRLDGRTIKVQLSRANGCELARWQRLAKLLVPTGPR